MSSTTDGNIDESDSLESISVSSSEISLFSSDVSESDDNDSDNESENEDNNDNYYTYTSYKYKQSLSDFDKLKRAILQRDIETLKELLSRCKQRDIDIILKFAVHSHSPHSISAIKIIMLAFPTNDVAYELLCELFKLGYTNTFILLLECGVYIKNDHLLHQSIYYNKYDFVKIILKYISKQVINWDAILMKIGFVHNTSIITELIKFEPKFKDMIANNRGNILTHCMIAHNFNLFEDLLKENLVSRVNDDEKQSDEDEEKQILNAFVIALKNNFYYSVGNINTSYYNFHYFSNELIIKYKHTLINNIDEIDTQDINDMIRYDRTDSIHLLYSLGCKNFNKEMLLFCYSFAMFTELKKILLKLEKIKRHELTRCIYIKHLESQLSKSKVWHK